MTDNSHTTIDVMRARRLALKCESSASAARSWAGILHGRLSSSRPMSDLTTSTAASIITELLISADDMRQTAIALATVLDVAAGSHR
jgi:hypothetical protein